MMMKGIIASFLLVLLPLVLCQPPPSNVPCTATGSLYTSGFNATFLNGTAFNLSQFSGKVTLIVNVASFCGMTDTDYPQLNQLVADFPPSSGFQIIGFPCAQFNNQEPGENHEILDCLKYVRPGSGFVPAFPLTEKIEVNGSGEHPIYSFIKEQCPAPGEFYGLAEYVSWNPLLINDITWNFGKTLFNKQGQAVRRYTPNSNPVTLKSEIAALLAQ